MYMVFKAIFIINTTHSTQHTESYDCVRMHAYMYMHLAFKELTYLSVKLSLIVLFLKLELDYLCAARTAPYHSYRNPVE